ncbi:MAG: hypothetical protein CMQ41_08520 [Gammaproteobacteria bacterium]|nr:hypothetical protein [Gammaproteobacteria bacterium]|tara:strand:+ start:2096 stop:2665 length:570 start_codon:yes stop_codon:yes gene_type:complete
MGITKREKNIISLAGIVAFVFLITNIFPAVLAQYQDRQASIEDVLLDIDRERRLIENTVTWRGRRVEVEQRARELEEQIFSGDTIPLVEADIQANLSQYARTSGITISSTRLAERLETNGWLMISQEMSFRTQAAGNTARFLERLEGSSPRLFVTDFAINRTRNLYNGTITVVGFVRSDGLIAASPDQG